MRSKSLRFSFYGLVAALLLALIGGIVYMLRAGGGSLPVIGQEPNFTATNVISGQDVSMGNLNGKIVLITWYYTHCTDECPLTMYRFSQIQDQLEKQGLFGKKVVLIAMTLDPTRDTPPVIKQYGEHFKANFNGWYFLRATPTQTIQILNKWGIQVKPSTDKEFIEHTSKTDLIDQNGNIRAAYNTANLDPQQVVANINSLVSRMSWL
ncbi:SCO family protein [Alicyclobacillus tolerans]|uniref:SCO family protein n=1 Tax=Alicyclobacillus tolerans TaxID=90970 RepID=UPI001F443B3E|nr:SCO family protein [Alicyclobacillus tolerans]MCF8567247.1 SCO family protein [Alicyclobacillus tolerans]